MASENTSVHDVVCLLLVRFTYSCTFRPKCKCVKCRKNIEPVNLPNWTLTVCETEMEPKSKMGDRNPSSNLVLFSLWGTLFKNSVSHLNFKMAAIFQDGRYFHRYKTRHPTLMILMIVILNAVFLTRRRSSLQLLCARMWKGVHKVLNIWSETVVVNNVSVYTEEMFDISLSRRCLWLDRVHTNS